MICFPDSLNLWEKSSLNKSGCIISELRFYKILTRLCHIALVCSFAILNQRDDKYCSTFLKDTSFSWDQA